VTTQFQIFCGRAGSWNLKTFTDLPTAILNEADLYLLALETPPMLDERFGPTGLDMYCGQAKCDTPNASKATGLALRLSHYESQMDTGLDPTNLQALRNPQRDKGGTLHMYLLCSLPGVRLYPRVAVLRRK
jgi:hypothetical protein